MGLRAAGGLGVAASIHVCVSSTYAVLLRASRSSHTVALKPSWQPSVVLRRWALLLLAGGESSAWSQWLEALLKHAIQASPLEFSSLWACCVRFAVHSLSESRSPALARLLESISDPVPAGEPHSVLGFPILKCLGHQLQ